MHVLHRRFMFIMILAALILIPSSVVAAQGQVLNYGAALIYSTSAESPFGFFSFEGQENDVITIQVMSLTPGYTPTVSVNDPTQQQVAVSSPDPLSPGLVRVTAQLESSGFYTILVGGAAAGIGQFSMRLDGIPGTVVETVSDDPLALTSSPLIIPVEADPDTAQQLTISATPEEVAFSAVLRNEDGQVMNTANGSGESPAMMTIPAGDMSYTLEVYAVDPAAGGEVTISLSPLGDTPDTDTTTATATPIPSEPTEVAADACQVTSPGNNINVRSGPSTDYAVIASLAAGESFPVLGENSGWYAIQLPDGTIGWAFSGVVQTTGDCSNVAFYEFTGESAPPPQTTEEAGESGQTGQATATYTPTATTSSQSSPATPTSTATSGSQPPQATPTSTNTSQPTATYTPSYTPTTEPAAQVAPEDSNYAFVMELDTTSSLLDFVSYPNGDTEDRVSYRVTGLNPSVAFSGGRAQLTITISCFGTNTDQIEVFADGRTYGCGDTVVDRIVNFDSNSGGVRITAIGGEGTYVQWVLTGTVTRLN